jgi:predicted GIY-YIG superfamily endonuclease
MSGAKEEYKNKLYAAQWEKIPKSWPKVEKIKIIIENSRFFCMSLLIQDF